MKTDLQHCILLEQQEPSITAHKKYRADVRPAYPNGGGRMRSATGYTLVGILAMVSLLGLSCERERSCVCEFIEADAPSGPGQVRVDTPATYSTAAAAIGHTVFEYRFDWGDGEVSPWSQSQSAAHAWSVIGSYRIAAQARDAEEPSAVSPWSNYVRICAVAQGPLQAPETPEGPGSLCMGEPGRFCVSEAPYGPGPVLEHQFDWGDGEFSPWSVDSCAEHTWQAPGCKFVAARRRIRGDSGSLSDWSRSKIVSCTHGYVTFFPPQGPDWLSPGEPGQYTVRLETGKCCETPEYQIDRDDALCKWTSDSCSILSWDLPGIYVLTARGRCADNPDIPISQWSRGSLVTVTDGRPVVRLVDGYLIRADEFESAPIHYLVISDAARWAQVAHDFTPFCEIQTPVEFSRHLVLVVLKISNDYWEMEVDRVSLKAGTLVFRYRAECVATDMSWTACCQLPVIVNRVSYDKVAFYENGTCVAVVDIP